MTKIEDFDFPKGLAQCEGFVSGKLIITKEKTFFLDEESGKMYLITSYITNWWDTDMEEV